MTTFYGTTSDAIAYLAARGITATITEPDLVVASEWLDNNFAEQFSGIKTGLRAQEREQPRTGQYDRDGNAIPVSEVPDEVVRATYEVAYRQNVSPGSLYTDATMGKNVVKAAVSGAVSVEYAGATDISDLQLMIPIVGKILAPILTGSGNVGNLSAPSRRV